MNRHVVRVMIVDNHDIVRRGVRSLIEGKLCYKVVGEANNAMKALEVARRTAPDLVVFDCLHQKEIGLAIAKRLKDEFPGLEIILFAPFKLETMVRQAIEIGVLGIVLKSEHVKHLLAAIDAASVRKRYLSPSLVDSWTLVTPHSRPGVYGASPSRRENEVVKLLAEGNTYKDIAGRLGISTKTVETYRASAMEKLGISSTAALVRYAVRNGLVAA